MTTDRREPAYDATPHYYVSSNEPDQIFARPVVTKRHGDGTPRATRMGFLVCTVAGGVSPAELAELLNRADPPEAAPIDV